MGKRKTQEEFEKEFYDIFGKEKFVIVGKYESTMSVIDIRCNRCNKVFQKRPNTILSRKRCSCTNCDRPKRRTYPNKSLWNTRPDIAEMLVSVEDGYNLTKTSSERVKFKCKNCDNVFYATPRQMIKNKNSCPHCSDSISYPNKFMYFLLRELGVDFQREYTIPNYSYRYDFYFEYLDKKYVIEMDGAFGHGVFDTPNTTIGEQLVIDMEKDVLANQYGLIMIRIDCKYTDMKNRFDYVKESVINSKLGKILDLSFIDFKQIDDKCVDSLVIKIADLWNNNVRSYDEFYNILKLKRPAVRKNLKRACEIGAINCSYEDLLKKIRLASNEKLANTKGSPVMCNETGIAYYSCSEASRKTNSNVVSYFYRNSSYAGILPDGTKLTWTKISKKEYQDYLKTIA